MRISRHTWLVVATTCITIVLALAGAELVCRLFSLAAPLQPVMGTFVKDPYLPYKPKPLSTDSGHAEEFDYVYTHNSVGFRDVEHTIEKPAGTYRILGIGDSFAYGFGVSFEQGFLSILQRKLDVQTGGQPKVEVIKAGIPRFYPETERILLEHYGIPYQPDVVVLALVSNDIADTYLGLDDVTTDSSGYLKTREAAELGSLGMTVYRYSHFGRLLLRLYIDHTAKQPHWDDMYRDHSFHENDWQKMEGELGKISAICNAAGAKLVILHIPQHVPNPTKWTDENRYMPKRIGAWAAAHHVYFVDALPVIERLPNQETLYYPKDRHCTARGYAVVADVLYDYLNAQHLVPAGPAGAHGPA
jgi:hypothetical protein